MLFLRLLKPFSKVPVAQLSTYANLRINQGMTPVHKKIADWQTRQISGSLTKPEPQPKFTEQNHVQNLLNLLNRSWFDLKNETLLVRATFQQIPFKRKKAFVLNSVTRVLARMDECQKTDHQGWQFTPPEPYDPEQYAFLREIAELLENVGTSRELESIFSRIKSSESFKYSFTDFNPHNTRNIPEIAALEAVIVGDLYSENARKSLKEYLLQDPDCLSASKFHAEVVQSSAEENSEEASYGYGCTGC